MEPARAITSVNDGTSEGRAGKSSTVKSMEKPVNRPMTSDRTAPERGSPTPHGCLGFHMAPSARAATERSVTSKGHGRAGYFLR
jgi:hypothetical protein